MAKLVVALDVNERKALDTIVSKLEGQSVWVKVGLEATSAFGLNLVSELKQKGFNVFADMKLHDIPNTVEWAARVVTRSGADMLNVHCMGGKAMCEAAVKGASEEAEKMGRDIPFVLGVTVLTSMGPEDLGAIGMRGTPRDCVIRLAAMGKEAGLNGMISSAQEIKVVREYFGPEFVILTPGIRPSGGEINDQKRIATPKDAVLAGADFLVVGRPITAAEDPAKACSLILEEMKEGESEVAG
jgi:orotidine-5'-phosphate decarboxylase